MDNVDNHGGGPGSSNQIQGKILPQLVFESFAETAQGLEIHHEKEDSTNERQVQNMIENYKTHLMQQQQKAVAIAATQHFRQLPNGSVNASGPPVQPPPPPPPTSHSHPCLFTMDGKQNSRQSDDCRQSPSHAIVTSDQVLGYYDGSAYANGTQTAQPATSTMFYQEQGGASMISVKLSDLNNLRSENEIFRKKIEMLEQKLGGLRQLEQAYDLIESEFERVVQQREQQELLEKTTMTKMDQQIQRLTAENIALLQRFEAAAESMSPPTHQTAVSDMRIAELTMLLNEYVAQNKNLQTQKDRHVVEIEAQNETLKEQRRHIDVLENALTNAQDKIAVKDRQIMESSALIDRCNKLQQVIQNMTEERDRRHEEYSKEKAQLEMDLALVKMQKENPSPHKNTRTSPEPEESSKLRRVLATKDERIAKLESDLLQIQRSFADEAGKTEFSITAEFEALNAQYRKLELEKLERERRVHEVVTENRRLHDHLSEERAAMDRRFGVLEEHIQRLAAQRPAPLPQRHDHAVSVTSLHTINDPSMEFERQRPASVDPAFRMEEMRRNIAARKQQPPPSLMTRSYSRPRMPSSSTANLSTFQAPKSPPPAQDHFRASSGPTSVIHSTVTSPSDKNQAIVGRQLADYLASLPESTRRRFMTATGLNDNFTGFIASPLPTPPQPQSTSSTPDLPEGAKLSLVRQTSKTNSNGDATISGVRIHLSDSDRPKLGHFEQSPSDGELHSRSGSESDSEPINLVQNNVNDVYSYDVQPPQTHTTTTTTIVEVNRDRLNEHANPGNGQSSNHRVVRSKVGRQKSLTRQASSAGSESVGGVTGSSESPR